MSHRTGEPVTSELADVVGPVWSEGKVCDTLGIDAIVLAERRAVGEVLGFTTAQGDVVYPVDQFQRHDGAVEVRPALLPFLRRLRRFDPWTVAVLLHTPAPELGDQNPLDWLRLGGDGQAVADLARTVAREWSTG